MPNELDITTEGGRGARTESADEAWFDGAGRDGAAARVATLPDVSRELESTKRRPRAALLLIAVIALLLIVGLATGAFSSPSEAPAPAPAATATDVEGLRQKAKANLGLAALDEATLYKDLDRLLAARPTPPAADVGAAVPMQDGSVAEPIETGTTVIAGDPKPLETPKPKEPKATDPKATDPKATEIPKGAVDEALAAAKTAADAKRWAEAKTQYDKALSLSPGNLKALMGRGRASFELRQLDAAAVDLKAVLAADPRHPSALQLLGSIAQEQGRKDEAKALYQRYLDAWPNGRAAEQIRAILERL